MHHGHEVLVESGAGLGAGLGDEQYVAAGARIVADADEIFADAELIVKVKEPLRSRAQAAARAARCCSPTCISRPIREQTEDLLKSRRRPPSPTRP